MDREPDVVIDARGEFCPVPVIRTADAMKRLAPGGALLVIADDPAIEFDLPAWARSARCACELVGREGREFRYEVTGDRSDEQREPYGR